MADKKTDRQTSGKTTHWQYTAYAEQYHFMDNLPPGISWEGHQVELTKTGREHYQGALISVAQHRWSGCKGDYKVGSTLRAILPGVHLEPAEDWPKLLQYCKKKDTRIEEFVSKKNEKIQQIIPDHFTYAETLAQKYVETYGIEDIDECQWEPIHSNTPPTKCGVQIKSVSNRFDPLIDKDIREGRRYAAWITTNPMWITMWKRRWKPFILSFSSINAPSSPLRPQDGQEEPRTQAPGEEARKQEGGFEPV